MNDDYELKKFEIHSEIEQKYRQRAFDIYIFAIKSLIAINLSSIVFFATYVEIFEKSINAIFVLSNTLFLISALISVWVAYPGLICIGRLMAANRYLFDGKSDKSKICEKQADDYEVKLGNLVLLSLGLYVLGVISFFAFIIF